MIPKDWKILQIHIDDVPWDFLIDGGVHSVFSTAFSRRILFTNILSEYTDYLGKNKIFCLINESQDIIKDYSNLYTNNYILKIEKKSTENIAEIISKIQFDLYSTNTNLYKYMNLPRIPLLFVLGYKFQLGWFEPNFSVTEINQFPIATCKTHANASRHYMNIEFKPKCGLPFIINNYTLYGILQKIVIENPIILKNANISIDCFMEEFNLISEYLKLNKNSIPCQISIQKLLENYMIQSNYNPKNLYFSNSYQSIFLEFLKVLRISGRIIKKDSIFNYNDFIKSKKNSDLIKKEIPLFIESIIYYSDIFSKLALYQTYCSGQQLLAFYLFNTLKIIFSDDEIEKLIISHVSKIHIEDEILENKNYEFYNKKICDNFQFGLLLLKKLIFNIKYISKNYNLINFENKIKCDMSKEMSLVTEEVTFWLFKFFFGRSVCDCSLIISVLYTDNDCFCPKSNDFKLLSNNLKGRDWKNIWTKIKIIDISNKPIEKIAVWKNQFINLLKKLISYEKKLEIN